MIHLLSIGVELKTFFLNTQFYTFCILTCNFTTPAYKRLRDRPPDTSMLQVKEITKPVNIYIYIPRS